MKYTLSKRSLSQDSPSAKKNPCLTLNISDLLLTRLISPQHVFCFTEPKTRQDKVDFFTHPVVRHCK